MNSRITLRLLGYGILLLSIFAVMGEVLGRDEIYRQKSRAFDELRGELVAITLGNSHNIAVHFETLGIAGFHFFDENSDVEEAYRKSWSLLDDLPSLKYVFMTLSPGSLLVSQRSVSDDPVGRLLSVRKNSPYALYERGYPFEVQLNAFVHRAFPVNHIQNKFYRLAGYENAPAPRDVLKQGPCYQPMSEAQIAEAYASDLEEGIVGGFRRSLLEPSCIPRLADLNTASRAEKISLSLSDDPELLRKNLGRLAGLAARLDDRAARLVIIVPPVTRAYHESPWFNELRDSHAGSVDWLRHQRGVAVLDFHDLFFDETDNGSNPYFFDDSHLALYGAVAFSGELATMLPDLGDVVRAGGFHVDAERARQLSTSSENNSVYSPAIRRAE